MKRSVIILITLLNAIIVIAKDNSIKEIYERDNRAKLHGVYKRYSGKNLQVIGEYNHGERNGLWSYQCDKNFKFSGHFKNGNLDSIWVYQYKNKIYCKINYRTQKIEKFDKYGNLLVKADSISDKYLINGYYQNGINSFIKEKKGDFLEERRYNRSSELISHVKYINDIPYHIYISKPSSGRSYYEGNIINGTGTGKEFYPIYNSNDHFEINHFSVKNGKLNGKYKSYYSKDKIEQEGQFINGVLDSVWVKYDFKSSKIDVMKSFDSSDSIVYDTINKLGFSESFVWIEEMPSFNGNHYNDFRSHIAKNLRYPSYCSENRVSGKVYVNFTVNSLGEIVNAKVVKGVHDLLDEEALRVVNLSPLWRPGFKDGRPVSVQFTFPIVFVLN